MALKNIKRLRELIPLSEFTTDIMVGFPGETEEDFEDTLRVMREAELIDAHIFAYSEREGTPAATYEGSVPVALRRDRVKRAMSERDRIKKKVLSRIVDTGEPLVCIAETYSDGEYTSHSDCFATVVFEAEEGLEGKRVLVDPVSNKNGKILGKFIKIM